MFYYPANLDRFFSGTAEPESTWSPVCEVENIEDKYLLSLEIAGVPKDRLKIEVVNDQLIVTGERESNQKSKTDDGWYSERKYGKFSRSFTLPDGVDESKIEAQFENGILKVAIPKVEIKKPLKIKIADENHQRIA